MRVLTIVNDQALRQRAPLPRGASRTAALAKRDNVKLRVVPLGDAVACALARQRPPESYYHVDRMLKPLIHTGNVTCGGACMNARALTQEQLLQRAYSSTLKDLTDWTSWAEKTVVF